tara:strand:- start:961 stop:3645 length:2685 start_codon:yes stop_codon:yes gene_type:complete
MQLVLFVLLLLVTTAPTQALTLEPSISGNLLGRQLDAWEEVTPLTNPQDIQQQVFDWQPQTAQIPNPGITRHPIWYRLQVDVPTPYDQWSALIGYALIDKLDVFVFQQDTLIGQYELGDHLPYEQRLVNDLEFQVPLDFSSTGNYTLYFRIENSGMLQFPLSLWTQAELKNHSQNRDIVLGIYIGFLVAIGIYNFALYIAIRRRYILYFVSFLSSYTIFFIALFGMGYRYIWPDFPWFEERATIFMSSFCLLFASLFSSEFLDAKPRFPKVVKAMKNLAIALSIVAIIATQIPDYPDAISVMMTLALIIPILLIIVTTMAGLSQRGSGRLYIIGLYLMALAIILHDLSRQGIIPMSLPLQYVSHIGAAGLILVHSLAIVWRLGEQRLALIKSQRAMLKAQEESINSQKRLQEAVKNRNQSEADNRAKSAFMAMMSHEIRTPLNGVLGMVELLQHTRLDQQQRQYIDTIADSGESLLSILNDILDLSKIESGKLQIEHRPLDLHELINNALMLYSRQSREKKLLLVANIHPPLFRTIIADELRLKQILLNFISNAIKFTQHGHVCVSAEIANSDLILTVTDTGIGIDKEYITRLFDSFSQADISTSRTHGGTGLGLAICKRLADAMGAKIQVSSSIGEGASFRLQLPNVMPADKIDLPSLSYSHFHLQLNNPIEQRTVSDFLLALGMHAENQHSTNNVVLITDSPDNRPRGYSSSLLLVDEHWSRFSSDIQLQRPLRTTELLNALLRLQQKQLLEQEHCSNESPPVIWIAEDNFVNQKVIGGLLKHLGVTYRVFDNGQELFETYKLSHEKPDLILMDCEMPIMDGFEATVNIRSTEATNNWHRAPIIALTAHPARDLEDQAKESGMDGIISKPIRKEALHRLCQQWSPNKKTPLI